MKSIRQFFTLLLALTFVLFAIPVNTYAANAQNKNYEFNKLSQLKKGSNNYLIEYKDEASKAKGIEKVKKNGGNVKKEFKYLKSTIKANLTPELLTELKNDIDVETVEPDSMVQAQGETAPWGVEEVNAPVAHNSGIRGEGVKVAVLDTGISSHPDISISGGASFVDDARSYNDDNGHGTHVAGIIASLINDQGLVGVAPNVSLYAAKVLSSDGGGEYSSVIEAIEWAVDNKINIINMSFGGNEYSKILENAVKLAYENNILLFASAGNNGTVGSDTITYPAKYTQVVAVGAVSQDGERAYFSSVGSDLELMAPGVDVNSTLNNGSYGVKSGTSMASPHAAGVAALLWSKDLSVSNDKIRGLINYSAKDLGDKAFYGNGLVDVSNALNIYSSYTSAQKSSEKTYSIKMQDKSKRTKVDINPTLNINSLAESYIVESVHPYTNNYSNTWIISKAEAANIRVHFNYIDTEASYDYVTTNAGDSWTGSYIGVWSSWSGSGSINVSLTTDGSVVKNGFYIDQIEYVPNISGPTVENYIVQCEHPYTNNYSNTWTIFKAGAANIRVHFNYIDTETSWDFVSTNAGDNWTGSYIGVWSSWSGCESIKVTLTTDASVVKNGFYIDQIEYIADVEQIPLDITKYITNVTEREYRLDISSANNYCIKTGYYLANCDTIIELYDANHNLITSNDDFGGTLYSGIYRQLNAGRYYVKVKEYHVGFNVNCYLLVQLEPDLIVVDIF